MKKGIILMMSMLAFAACKKYESPSSDGGTPLPHHIDRVYHVGDYFHNDTLEGIVFYTYWICIRIVVCSYIIDSF